jgi:hypothetical protein
MKSLNNVHKLCNGISSWTIYPGNDLSTTNNTSESGIRKYDPKELTMKQMLPHVSESQGYKFNWIEGNTHKKPEERYTEFGALNSLRYAWILNVKVELELFDVPPFLVFWS